MSWKLIIKSEVDSWNEKLKRTNAPFSQYPYFIRAEYTFWMSGVIFLAYIRDGKELAFCAIAEIGIYPFRIGVIESGPILLHDDIPSDSIPSDDIPSGTMLEELKQFARTRRYMYLQIRPLTGQLEAGLKTDPQFRERVLFPFHRKEEADLNIYHTPEPALLPSLKLQCRRKIVLAGRMPFTFRKVEDESELKEILSLFNKVAKQKGYNLTPSPILLNMFRNGKKHHLCDIYTARLNEEIVNAVFIVKDAQSYYHLSSALLVNGFKENESPSAKLHYFILQDCFYTEEKEYYNISYGGSDNLVRFKNLFNPVTVIRPPYYTYVINRFSTSLLQIISPEKTTLLRNGLKRINHLITRLVK